MRSVEEIKEMIHANRKMQEILSRRDSAPASLSFIREIDDFVAGSGGTGGVYPCNRLQSGVFFDGYTESVSGPDRL